jgi:hypothetical protein
VPWFKFIKSLLSKMGTNGEKPGGSGGRDERGGAPVVGAEKEMECSGDEPASGTEEGRGWGITGLYRPAQGRRLGKARL